MIITDNTKEMSSTSKKDLMIEIILKSKEGEIKGIIHVPYRREMIKEVIIS